jgi:hypothetical protein
MKTVPHSKPWLVFWWLIWAAVLGQQLALHSWRGTWFQDNPEFNRTSFAVLISILAISVILRWLVLSRVSSTPIAFVVFVIGISCAGGMGLASSFMDVPFKQSFFTLCLAGVIEYAPLRAGRQHEAA